MEFEDFIHSEVEKIKIDKWIEGKKIHRDPGVEFEMMWVNSNAKNYRDAWCKSKCRTCKNCQRCGYNVISACDNYEEMV